MNPDREAVIVAYIDRGMDTCRNANTNATQVWFALWRLAEPAGIKAITGVIKRSRGKVQKSLALLLKAGWIRKTFHGGGQRGESKYVVTVAPVAAPQENQVNT